MAKLYARKSDGTYIPYNPQSVTNIDVVQTTGDSVTAAMSQDAVTKELATKQNVLTDTDGGYGQRVAELEKEGIASQEKLSELGKQFTNEYPFGLPVYVSSSEGSDDNDGTIEHPYRTINFAISVSNTIRLKCGDIFYESLHSNTPIITKNLDIRPYGVGNKPMLCGYKIPHMNKGLWVNESENIWKINLADDSLNFDGYKTGSSLLNNIGAVVELDKDISSTCRKKTKAELSENYDIWQPATSYDIPSDYDNLYMYYDGDPNQINLALCVYGSAFALRKSSVIEGLSIKGFGFGISLRSNCIIKDCDIDLIGGSSFFAEGDSAAAYGNGIEIFIGHDTLEAKNVIVTGCNISRVYDCGLTVQGENTDEVLVAENITFTGNHIRNCGQAFEEFLRGSDDRTIFKNCSFSNNICIRNGKDTGFRYPENYKLCQLLSGSWKRNTYFKIVNNSFVDSTFYVTAGYKSQIHIGNTCSIRRGELLFSQYAGVYDRLVIPREKGTFKTLKEATENVINKYREFTDDYTTTFEIIEDADLVTDMFRDKYISMGAVYNETTGYYELNGLTDITEKEMSDIYINGAFSNVLGSGWMNKDARTNFINSRLITNISYGISTSQRVDWQCLAINNKILEVFNVGTGTSKAGIPVDNFGYVFIGCSKLKRIIGVINLRREYQNYWNSFRGCSSLEDLSIKVINSISFADCPNLSNASILYMIQNATPKNDMTITLHPTAYARAMANADIVAALQAHPNVSLASA